MVLLKETSTTFVEREKHMKKRLIAALAVCIVMVLTGCTEADKVNYNMSQQASYFESERRITVYNARTDRIILYAEGYMDISNNSTNELVVTVKTGPGTYKKNYIYVYECEYLCDDY